MRLPLLAALLLAAPACAATPPPQRTAEALNAHPAMWVVRDSDTTIYLFGTVHVLRPDTRWYGGAVKRALESAGELRLEIVSGNADEMVALVNGIATAPATAPALSERLAPAERAKYIAQMEANGLPWRQLERLDPWFVTITLSNAPLEKLGYSKDSGVEAKLSAAAKALGKPVVGMETPAEQLGFFDGLSEQAQIALLNATVEELPETGSALGKLISAWAAGEDRKLAEELNESLTSAPELADVLLIRRNRRWAGWIAERMKLPGTVFIAVGAGHLAGDKSVQADLARLGYKASRVRTGK